MRRWIPLLLLAPTLVGCIDTKITSPNGYSFRTRRFLWSGQIAEASVTTNGVMYLKGYTSDAAAVAEAVAKGIVSGIKPVP